MKLSKIVVIGLFLSGSAFAEQTVGEKINAEANKAATATKEVYRNAKDKACEMVNGKLECVGQKVKHKAKTTVEKLENKTKEAKDKVDSN